MVQGVERRLSRLYKMDLLSFLGTLLKGIGCVLDNPLMSVSEPTLIKAGRHIIVQELFREDILKQIRDGHPRRILVCYLCGWSWLTVETAEILYLPGTFLVVCRDVHDCYRRERMNVRGLPEKEPFAIAEKELP